MTTALPPLIFEPALVPKPWGGRHLELLGKHLPGAGQFGESWEVSPLPQGENNRPAPSRVAQGPFAGWPLPDLVEQFGTALHGSASEFPLLCKFLDARQPLSVQVHPGPHYAAAHAGMHTKTESWYVVDADPDAVIYQGWRSGVTVDDIGAAAGNPEIVDLLRAFPAQPGAFHHLPAGVVHALGAGLLIAEPQTPADTTLRLYDWGDIYERPRRSLHLEEAREALVFDPPGSTHLAPMAAPGSRLLTNNPFYRMWEHRLQTGALSLSDDGELRVLVIINGNLHLEYEDGPPVWGLTGTTVVLPAATVPRVTPTVTGPTIALEISPTPVANR